MLFVTQGRVRGMASGGYLQTDILSAKKRKKGELLGAGVAAVLKAPETAAKSYDLHLTSSYKTQTS